jgi:predicted dehydrogenase
LSRYSDRGFGLSAFGTKTLELVGRQVGWGGLLGAIGSHAIDQLRWLFGEITGAWGVVETMIPFPRRRDYRREGELTPTTTPHFWFASSPVTHQAQMQLGTVVLSAVYAAGGRNGI